MVQYALYLTGYSCLELFIVITAKSSYAEKKNLPKKELPVAEPTAYCLPLSFNGIKGMYIINAYKVEKKKKSQHAQTF